MITRIRSNSRQRPPRGVSHDEDVNVVGESTALTRPTGGPRSIDQQPFHAANVFEELTENRGWPLGSRDQIAHERVQRVLTVRTHQSNTTLQTITEDVSIDKPSDLTVHHHRTADAGSSADLGERALSFGCPNVSARMAPVAEEDSSQNRVISSGYRKIQGV